MPGSGRTLARAFGVFGALICGLYALSPSITVQHVGIGVLGVCSCLAIMAGLLVYRPVFRLPWVLFAVSCWVFLAGVVLRPIVDLQNPATVIEVNLLTAAGYIAMACGLSLLLKAGDGLRRYALPDGIIVCLGAGFALVVLCVLPASRTGMGGLTAGFTGLYPMFDVVIMLLLLNVGFTTDLRLPAFRSMSLGLVCLLVGDLGYAWLSRSGAMMGSSLLDLPFAAGYACLGFTALHPSMTLLTQETASRRIQAWSLARLAMIVSAVAVPIGVLLLEPGDAGNHPATRTGAAVVLALMVLIILARARSAIHGMTLAQQATEHLATHDPLTGLPNRVQLVHWLDRRIAGSRPGEPPVWLVLVGLDRLNVINDSWGHRTGEEAVTEVGRRLSGATAAAGLVAAVGPDVFGVAVRATQQQLDQVVSGIQQEMKRPIEIAGIELVVQAALGIASAEGDGNGQSLLRNADTAMYRARATGHTGTMVFDPSMRKRAREHLELEHDLRRALAQDQLWVAFQPIVDISSESVTGAEALVRWAHPVRGDVPPSDFIPLAEEAGLIQQIGGWVLREALRQTGLWLRSGRVPGDFFVSVNASAYQLRDDSLRDLAATTLREFDLPAANLVIEITESVMMDGRDSTAGAIPILNGLRAEGIRLSVDDFGTGYSSLGYLSRFPVTGVKIDRAFVSVLDGGPDGKPQDEAIVRAVAAMGQALGLTVVAEGVETLAQRDVLRRLGVDQGQGWLWGRPVAGDDFVAAHFPVPAVRTATAGSARALRGGGHAQPR